DGDGELDRAVGPMQFIPQAWRNWHIDANEDGVEDPHSIDDAVMATANYLCRASGDMRSEGGWRQAIGAFNASDAYIQSVADVANRLAADAAVVTP
ncbi:MAG TPA: lytic murein transglycosylase, partial [Terrimesophilobacter sp.]|nr:lytic murein transglycosylase [Terrimesophilobacter sp.]